MFLYSIQCHMYHIWPMTCADSDLKDSPNSALSFCIWLMWLATHCMTSQASINSNKEANCNLARGKLYVLHFLFAKKFLMLSDSYFIKWNPSLFELSTTTCNIRGKLELKLTFYNSVWSKRRYGLCKDSSIQL